MDTRSDVLVLKTVRLSAISFSANVQSTLKPSRYLKKKIFYGTKELTRANIRISCSKQQSYTVRDVNLINASPPPVISTASDSLTRPVFVCVQKGE